MSELKLFEAIGVELEYMIVDRTSLGIRPVADSLLEEAGGGHNLEVERGHVAWSNELTLHVVELKTNGPATSLEGLAGRFHASVTEIDRLLGPRRCRLMPTAMHPFMNPVEEALLWPHENTEIYEAYDRIFDCKGHGWSNLQSTHINFPFSGDDEFRRLHAAIRVLMPVLPALTASSPVVEGQLTQFLDNRLEFYRQNQRKIPSITGSVIPEPIYSRKGYEELLEEIYKDIRPHDPGNVLCEEWLNSRGAIARFERGSIELRTLDIQECVSADLAVVAATVALVKRLALASEEVVESMAGWDTEVLSDVFVASLHQGESTYLQGLPYHQLLGLDEPCPTAGDFWIAVCPMIVEDIPEELREVWETLVSRGNLASQIRKALGPNPDQARIVSVYESLCDCLHQDRLYLTD